MQRHTLFIVSLLILTTLSLARSKEESKKEEAEPQSEAVKEYTGLKYTIQVQEFDDKSGVAAIPVEWKIAMPWLQDGAGDPSSAPALPSALQSMLNNALHESGAFLVVAPSREREDLRKNKYESETSEVVKGDRTAQAGKMAPAQLLVYASIIGQGVTESKGNRVGNLLGTGIGVGSKKETSEITFQIDVYDATTGLTVASKTITGTSVSKSKSSNFFGLEQSKETNDNLALASMDALNQAVNLIINSLDVIPWVGTVVGKTPDGKVMINAGERESVKQGQKFTAGKADRVEDPDTGETLDWWVEEAAILEVTELKDKMAYCKIVSSKGDIVKGMKITPSK
jgi:curli biogenesis system outer membrane secretion channel CsgG